MTDDDCSVISTPLACLSKEVPTSGFEFADLARVLVDEVEASHAVTAKGKKEAERQEKLVSIAKKLTNNALMDVTSFHGRVSVSSTRETELLSSAPTASSQVARPTTE